MAHISVFGATSVQNDSTPVTEGGAFSATRLTFNQFDSDLGTLTGVTIDLQLTMPSFDLKVDNDTSAQATFSVTFGTVGGVQFQYSLPFISTLDTAGTDLLDATDFQVTTQNSGSQTVAASDGDSTAQFDDDSSSDNYTFSTTAVAVGDTSHEIGAGYIANYADPNPTSFTFDIIADFITDINVSPGGGTGDVRLSAVIPTATFSGTVTYTYTPIPEPSTYAALFGALALGAVVYVRRRK